MKLAVFACLVATTCAAVMPSSRTMPALQHEEVHDQYGQYALRYVTAEGTIVSQRGRLIPSADGKSYVLVTEGENSFYGPDGRLYKTTFSAGPDGAKFDGDHLPQAPVA